MPAPPAPSAYREWASATDLAEYAYCPRSWYYRSHLAEDERSPEHRASSSAGEAFHAHALDHDWDQEHHLARYVLVLLAGAALLSGGLLWIFW